MLLLVGSGAGSSDNIGHIPVWLWYGRCSRVVASGLEMCALDGVNTRSLAGFGCESFVVVRCTGFMDGDYPGNLSWGRHTGDGKFDKRKSQLHHFTIGFQKPGIYTDSWFLESNGEMVQLGFSLIKNRAPQGLGFCSHRTIFFAPGHAHQLTSSVQIPGFWNPMVKVWSTRIGQNMSI
jgi:hypothetical protein